MVAVRDRRAVSDWVRSSQRLCLLEGEIEDVTPTREVHCSELFQIKACGNVSARVLFGCLDLIFRKHPLSLLRMSMSIIEIILLPFFPFSFPCLSYCLFSLHHSVYPSFQFRYTVWSWMDSDILFSSSSFDWLGRLFCSHFRINLNTLSLADSWQDSWTVDQPAARPLPT
jgi:hypothetical protein